MDGPVSYARVIVMDRFDLSQTQQQTQGFDIEVNNMHFRHVLVVFVLSGHVRSVIVRRLRPLPLPGLFLPHLLPIISLIVCLICSSCVLLIPIVCFTCVLSLFPLLYKFSLSVVPCRIVIVCLRDAMPVSCIFSSSVYLVSY